MENTIFEFLIGNTSVLVKVIDGTVYAQIEGIEHGYIPLKDVPEPGPFFKTQPYELRGNISLDFYIKENTGQSAVLVVTITTKGEYWSYEKSFDGDWLPAPTRTEEKIFRINLGHPELNVAAG
jgi:hypothetical protein